MSSAVERPNTYGTPPFEQSYEPQWDEWLQPDTSPLVSPRHRVPITTDLRNSHNFDQLVDIQEWALPLSQRLLVSDVQSPGALRPYGTPLATEKSVPREDDGYFSFQPQIALDTPLEVIHHHQIPQFQIEFSPTLYHDRSSFSAESFQPESSRTPTRHQHPNLDHTPSQTVQAVKKRKISVDDPMRIKQYGHSAGPAGGVMIEWGKQPSRRSRMDDQRKLAYRDTRRKGACENCKRQRRRCIRTCYPYIECLKSKPLIFLDHPVDARLFRLRPSAGHPLASEKPELYALHELSPFRFRMITNYISQGIDGTLPMQVVLCEFEPHPELKTSHLYTTALAYQQHFELPRYCLANMEETTIALEAFIKRSWCSYLQAIILDADPISQNVLQQAQKYAIINSDKGTGMVRRALMLLAVNRMIERNWTFEGYDDVPGIYVVGNPDNPWYGKRPITPVMDTQLDQIIIQTFLTPLRTKLLLDLQDKIAHGGKQDAFEIFLTVFILQTNIALLLRHSNANAKRCGAGRRYNSIKLAQEYIHSSNILLAHFHYGASGAAGLLRMSGSKKPAHRVAREHEEFLSQIVPRVHACRDTLMSLRSDKKYEDDLFWTHQMFFEDWVPEDKTIAEM